MSSTCDYDYGETWLRWTPASGHRHSCSCINVNHLNGICIPLVLLSKGALRIPILLGPHSIIKLFAFLLYIGYFKDSTQHWSILMLCELVKYFKKCDLWIVFAQYCIYLKFLLLKRFCYVSFILIKAAFVYMYAQWRSACACMCKNLHANRALALSRHYEPWSAADFCITLWDHAQNG